MNQKIVYNQQNIYNNQQPMGQLNSLLAVVIPCWNEGKLLSYMLDCLLKQTFQDWRAYCVEGQSTDRTADIIKAYQAK